MIILVKTLVFYEKIYEYGDVHVMGKLHWKVVHDHCDQEADGLFYNHLAFSLFWYSLEHNSMHLFRSTVCIMTI